MDEKARKRELTEFFFKKLHFLGDPGSSQEHQFITELNGWEGLIVWAPNGLFYQMNYKSYAVWHITMFSYDIYGKKVFEKGEWHVKGV